MDQPKIKIEYDKIRNINLSIENINFYVLMYWHKIVQSLLNSANIAQN